MRFLELHLPAYGPFTNVSLDLSQGRQGLHVVYGPNEAGKSSALRAIRALLFGMPERTHDNFVHDYRDLRVGARLRDAAGAERMLWRRKGKRDTLLDASLAPVDERVLTALLGGITETLFDDAFGLDHEGLVKGGRTLLAGQGEVGESLFAAALGTGRLRQLLVELDEQAEGLFKGKGASKPRLNQLLRAHREQQADLGKILVSARDWRAAETAAEEAKRAVYRLDEAMATASRERERLQRLHKCLPKLAEQRALEQTLIELEANGPLPALPDTFERERGQVLAARAETAGRLALASTALERTQAELGSLGGSLALLEQAEAIETLRDRAIAQRKPEQDRLRLETQRRQALADARSALHRWRPTAELDASAPTLGVVEKRRIDEAGEALAAALLGLATAEKDLSRRARDLAEATRTFAAAPEPADPTALLRLVARARKQGDLEDEAARLRDEAGVLRRTLAGERESLLGYAGELEVLPRLALPPVATIERFARKWQDAERVLADAERRAAEAHERLAAADKELARLERSAAIPTERDLAAGREHREADWQLVRRVWLQGGGLAEGARAFLSPQELAAAYEAAVRHADDIADRLRDDAERVAGKLHLLERQQDARAEGASWATQAEDARKHSAALGAEWRALWAPVGVDPLPPMEMHGWPAKAERIVAMVHAAREAEVAAATATEHARRLAGEIAASLDALGGIGDHAERGSLAALLDRAEDFGETLAAAAAQRADLAAQGERAKAQHKEAAEDLRLAQESLARARARWAKALEPLQLPAESSPSEVRVVLATIDTIELKLHDAEGLARRIAGIDRDAATLAESVAATVGELAPDLASLAPPAAVDELARRLAAARKLATQRDACTRQHEHWRDEHLAAGEAMATLDRRLAGLLAVAGVEREVDLPAAEARVRLAREKRARLAAVESDLLLEGKGIGLDALHAEAAGIEPDVLPGLLEQATRRHGELAAARDRAADEAGARRRDLEALRGGASAPEAAERASAIAAEMRHVAGEYARLHLARTILRRAIEAYRQAHQGPLLERAAALFSKITCGAFSGLLPDYGEDDKPTLRAVRANDSRLAVEGMSDGTREQLYLALRLASLERHLDGPEPMPLIVDDLLLRSDDERAAAILDVLADLSAKTQVLFFTHQRRFAAMATDLARPTEVFVQTLDA